ncbi:MAG: 23S rRNA (adenine(2503)-C(2))-methyltransferase RlmN [Ruminococcaceae bacterium]|nr:23S rRNA (adenine(2503)-C(2))-methyltransferase RlmN [Oscillospiraceae bacterium]
MKKDIVSMNFEELSIELKEMGLPKFRATQIYDWLHKKCVASFDEMTNISKDLINKLNDNFVIFSCTIEKKLVSQYDNTVKYLFSLPDGEYLECVVMDYKYGHTICVSTQVGCKMGCAFCASGIGGFKRQLAPSEILGQIYAAQRDLGLRISRIVLMGMGEPLDNYDNVMKFLQLVSDERGLNIGMRHISLSTSGIVPRIYDLLNERLQLTLSVSLHAPNNEIRSKIMPVNKSWNIEELLNACKIYADTTSRRISFEYAMMKGVNDTPECARELSKRLKGILCHINLIPANEVPEKGHERSSDSSINLFKSILEKDGHAVTVRRTLGSDINASCGQLRREKIKENQN